MVKTSKQKMKTPSDIVFSLCCFLMALLFALSASFQFNDPDWYLWFPLYAVACIVNLVNGFGINNRIKDAAKFAFWLGVLLFIKVVIEDMSHGKSGVWSLDMRERLVREKLGSGLVLASMSFHLYTSVASNPIKGRNPKVAKLSKYGMLILVATGYGLSFAFFTFHQREMGF